MRIAALLVLAACGGGQAAADAGLDSGSDVQSGPDGAVDAGGGDADAALPGDAGGCGTRTGMRGLTSRTLMMTTAPTTRTYLVYLPQSFNPATPTPLVFVMHGYTMSGKAMHDITQYADIADSEGIAVAFPDGEGGPNSLLAPWNVSTGNCYPGDLESATGDDFGFLEAMRADIAKDQCIDTSHTFVTGFSMGGYFSHHTGCMRPDLARAVAPHSGGTHPFGSCVTGHEPVIVFHGDSDPVVAESCDDSAVMQWIQKNGCQTTADVVAVTNGSCSYYRGCPADGQVAYCKFTGLGHAWAGGAADAGAFSAPSYASATQLEWAFFKKYAW
jgi:polyhydroxybutyrate depolymerase